MKLTLKFDDTDSDASRRAGILLSELGKALNPEPMRRFGNKNAVVGGSGPDTVEEVMAARSGLERQAFEAAEAVLQEYRSVGEDSYFLASHLARIILPFFSKPAV